MMSEENKPSEETKPNRDIRHRVPWWVIAVIILCMLPGIGFPFMGNLLASGDVMIKWLTWFYPIYTLVSGLLAWQCYGRRSYLTWVILVLLLLSHGCFYYLASIAGSLQTFR